MKALKDLLKGQEGMTGLETAIILIAFVTVAAVFGYAVLSAGLFSAERGKETIYAGLQQARANMEVVGSVIAYGDNATNSPTKVSRVLFTCRDAIAGTPIDMTPNRGGRENRCIISLTTTTAYYNNVKWTAQFVGNHDNDQLLEAGEQLEITLDMVDLGAGFGDPVIGPNAIFNIQVKPTQGSTMTIQRTLPAAMDPVMDLDLMTGSGSTGAGGGGGGGGTGTPSLICTRVQAFYMLGKFDLHLYLQNNGTGSAHISPSSLTIAVDGGGAVAPSFWWVNGESTNPFAAGETCHVGITTSQPPVTLLLGQTFTVTVTPDGGAALSITRTIPATLNGGYNELP